VYLYYSFLGFRGLKEITQSFFVSSCKVMSAYLGRATIIISWDMIIQKRSIFLRSLLIVTTPYVCMYVYYMYICSDTPTIDHLVIGKFVTGPPSYRLIIPPTYRGVRVQFVWRGGRWSVYRLMYTICIMYMYVQKSVREGIRRGELSKTTILPFSQDRIFAQLAEEFNYSLFERLQCFPFL